MKNDFDIIGFDADDTLWLNQPNYDEVEEKYTELLSNFLSKKELSKKLYTVEMQNITRYGFGAKSFMLSMIETAIKVSNNNVTISTINEIINFGKTLIDKPVVLIDGVKDVLNFFKNLDIKLILVTKGDLIDQERKLKKSNIKKYFHHIEIMSNKSEIDYTKLLSKLAVSPERFLMIGNSIKSDILPVIKIGGTAIHVPYHTTWQHEDIDSFEKHPNLIEVRFIRQLIELFTT